MSQNKHKSRGNANKKRKRQEREEENDRKKETMVREKELRYIPRQSWETSMMRHRALFISLAHENLRKPGTTDFLPSLTTVAFG